MLTTAAVIGALTGLGARERAADPLAAQPVPSPTAEPALAGAPEGAVLVHALATTNVYASPDRSSGLVAILPSGEPAAATGRSSDGTWLRVVSPPQSRLAGWAPAGVLGGEQRALAALPAVTTETPATARRAPQPAERLPDLVVAEAYLLDDGRLALGILNSGSAPLVEIVVPLRISKAEGDLVGVLHVGPTTLGPGGRATVVTPLVISEPGSYRIVIDAANEIVESQESNNSLAALLIPRR